MGAFAITDKRAQQEYIWLAILGALGLALIIRFYPLTEFSLAPAGFSSYVAFSDYHTLESGHLVEPQDIKVYDQFSAQLHTATQIHPILVLRPIISVVTGLETTSWLYSLVLSIIFGFPFLLAVLLLARTKGRIGTVDSFIIALYALLVTPTAILTITYGGSTLGYLVIVFALYFYLQGNEVRRRGIIILLAAMMAISYFTGGLAFLGLMLFIVLFELCAKPRITSTFHFTLLYSVIFLSYLMYISTSRFGGLVHMGEVIVLLLQGKMDIATRAGMGPLVNPYLTSTSLANKLRLTINAFFVVIPFAYFIIWGRRYFKAQKERFVAFSTAFFLVPLILLTFLAIGGVGRMVEYGALASVILFALMAGRIKQSHWKLLRIVVILAVLSSTYAYVMTENRPITRLTYAEQYAADFLSPLIDEQSVVFTDYRLAAPLLGRGHFRTTGIDMLKPKDVEPDLATLRDIYWGDDTEAAMDALGQIKLGGENVDYLLFSKGMTQALPGIRTYTFNFKPAPADFHSKYDRASPITCIYNNGDAFIYKMR